MDNELYNKRMAICMECPLIKESPYGPICNPSMWINPKTGETSKVPRLGYRRGCSCAVKKKAKNPNNHCIADKW